MSEEDKRAAAVAVLPPTEHRLAASANLDLMPSLEVLQLLNSQDRIAVEAVQAVLPELAELVDIAAERFRSGGNIHYFGAGTSGRLAVLDAAELLPTFNLPNGRVVAHIAGGERAFVQAVENAEDSIQEGSLAADTLGEHDVAIGFAASGNTPYVGGALTRARELGAVTALVSSNPGARLEPLADIHICVDTGAEVLTGSTRLKAATAEKLVLNGFSTALMVAVGRTWSNLMVSLVATNDKLRLRTLRILSEATGLDQEAAEVLLSEANGDLKTAIVMSLASVECDEAGAALQQGKSSVRAALEVLQSPATN
ncbi:N-acetylmuramic acid 6-phosphate etherase [Leucobacter sp. UT-8R-CII-1-4]|uniref:N-acetylmuramic acid 6-phosphate etherase n=1 Tax=Leucobacter sp. UT-8R-CII-1-4 TaxID=3040075 RepID=UPI0024A8BE7F|nr:N-acetylmuramic acid 6-phosphate etherase [Leucobacter sp. UT-8R-CII-1-4]MDI6022588.1 N-acetylmuramic acid 6-phosphate etherase [Leucobacter sp. UT-8R-CII-1-4]